MKNHSEQIKIKFQEYIENSSYKFLLIEISLIVAIVSWFAFSDYTIRQNINAFYTRFFTLGIGIPLLFFELFTKNKHKALKLKLYNILTASTLVMMFSKYLVYLPYEGPEYTVSGIVVVVFIISLDLKAKFHNALIIYFLPTIIFLIVLHYFVEVPQSKIVNLTNLIPMIILGFAANRMQYNLRFKLFLSNHYLISQKQKTKELYEESVAMNEHLQQKNEEIRVQSQAIEEKNIALEEANATKNKFFSIIAHDLKSPFISLIGFSNLLITEYDNYSETKRKKFISNINKSAVSYKKLLDNLLSWSESQLNTIKIKYEFQNLFLLTEEVIDFFVHTAENKNIVIKNLIADDLLIYADTQILQTLLRNLISNAIKFSNKNTSIKIMSDTFRNDFGQNFVKIIVEDSGIGISEDKQQKLFEISKKTSTKGTDNESGTGLGLILSKELIEKHGGEIWVESKINKGSRFIFTVPDN